MERGIEDFTEDKKRWEKGLKVERNEEREEASTPLSKAELKSAGERERTESLNEPVHSPAYGYTENPVPSLATNPVAELAAGALSAVQMDNWKHRSKGMLCATCMFFVEKLTTAIQPEDRCIGRCRRRAPTMNGFPVIYSSDWCGDHKIDETKI